MSYQIVKGTTIGGIKCYKELVGYDWDTGEEEYEECYETIFDPHEEVIAEIASYDEARKEYNRITDEFSEQLHWPWYDAGCEFYNGECRTEFTDNEDKYWFILRESKSEAEIQAELAEMKSKDFDKMYWEMHDRYNPYPYQESCATIFGKAMAAGEIDKRTYDLAHKYFGSRWLYCGD